MSRFPRFRGRAARRLVVVSVLALATALAVRGQDRPEPIATSHAPALDAIRADSLRGHLSFLASDLLEGRGTPSRGLDIAAEYIASRFRAAGLEPAGDSDYFQRAHLKVLGPDPDSYQFTMTLGDERFPLPIRRVTLHAGGKIDLRRVGLRKVAASDPKALEDLDPRLFHDQAIVFDPPRNAILFDPPRPVPETDNERAEAIRLGGRLLAALRRLEPALLIVLDRGSTEGAGLGPTPLIDPERTSARPSGASHGNAPPSPTIRVHDPALIAALEACPAGPIEGTASLALGEPGLRPVLLKNVAGLLRGSDPVLKDEYVIVSAHYDHLGIGGPVEGDRIYNGANDDASGTAMVVELAEALAGAEPPGRSLLFLTFFGEEQGLVGSRYYGRHPLVPLKATVAHLNLEQVGRTDDSEGPRDGQASLTGFDFSEVGAILREAGRSTGVKVFKHPRNSDAFFSRSDNQALADLGIPAHTLCVAYLFPDYHGVGDHWEKIDFENMERVARTVALGLLKLADRPERPQWNADEPLADRYRKAWRTLLENP